MKNRENIFRITDIHPSSAWFNDAHFIIGAKGTIRNLQISSNLPGWSYFTFTPKTRRRPRRAGSYDYIMNSWIVLGKAKFEQTTWRGIRG